TPQLIQPLAFDQFDNAARIEKLGVGKMILKRNFKASNIVQHLQALLGSSDVKTQCQSLQNNFLGNDYLRESCHLLEATFRMV
ncbi:MAG: hypothetical protein ABI618_08455, partial [Nitrospirota bacterium]